jgi:translation initiation factor 2-alpha kinase 3
MPKYWEDSADLSRDSSAESDEDLEEVAEEHAEPQDGSKGRATEESRRNNLQREQTAISQTESIEEVQRDSHVDETVSRLLASNATQPSLEPHQHASLFYLSLIEGRCRSQAANSINQDRTLEAHVTENSPEVEILAEHMFGEMIKELSKAGMVPEEFVHRPVSELRSYLRSFDSILQVLATPLQTLSLHPGNREIDDNFESGFMQSLSSLPNTNAAPARTQLLSTKSSAIEFPSTSDIFDRSAEVNEANKGFSPHSGTVLGRTQDLISQSDFTDSIASAFGILDQSQALIPRNQSGVILPNTFLGHGTPFSFTDAHVTDFSLPKSVFATEYRTTALLGQGGFGKVVKVRSKLDMAEVGVLDNVESNGY